jgi:hypothetical protein
MSYLNSVTIVGFVGADPEQRQARNNGSKFTVLSVATQRSWKNAQDEWSSKTEWHRICVFRPRLESRFRGETLQRAPRKADAKDADHRRGTADSRCSSRLSSRGDRPSRSDRRKNVQRGLFPPLGKLIRLNNNVKTPGSAEPIPLSQYACDVLHAWKKEQASRSEYVFPSPVLPNRPISTVKNRLENDVETSWRDGIPDLQPASRLLYSSQRSCSGCSRAACYAPHEPGNQASLPVGNGRSGSKRGRQNEQTIVRKASGVTFP